MNTDPLIVPQRCYDAAVKSVLKKYHRNKILTCTYGSGLGSFGLVTSFSIGRTGFLTSFGGLMTFGGEVSLSEGGVGGGVGEGDFKRSLGSVSSGDGKSRRASFS